MNGFMGNAAEIATRYEYVEFETLLARDLQPRTPSHQSLY